MEKLYAEDLAVAAAFKILEVQPTYFLGISNDTAEGARRFSDFAKQLASHFEANFEGNIHVSDVAKVLNKA